MLWLLVLGMELTVLTKDMRIFGGKMSKTAERHNVQQKL